MKKLNKYKSAVEMCNISLNAYDDLILPKIDLKELDNIYSLIELNATQGYTSFIVTSISDITKFFLTSKGYTISRVDFRTYRVHWEHSFFFNDNDSNSLL